MKNLLLTTFILLFSSTLFAKSNSLPGYIILANGERIEGYLDYQDREKNPRKAVFRTSPEGNPRVYLPIELKAFGVVGERFQSAIVETEISPQRTSKLTRDQKLNIVMDTAFLRTIIDGPKSLYQFRNDAGTDNFYIGEKDKSGQDQFILLRYKRYLKIKDGALMSVSVNLYQLQLDHYFLDCPNFLGRINEAKYQLSDLEFLFEEWYECTGLEATFHKKRDKVQFEFGLLAGMTRTQLDFTSEAFSYLDNSVYEPSYNISGGMFMNIVLARNRRRWSINSELMWRSYSTQADYSETRSLGNDITWHTEFGYSYIALNNMLRYRWPVGSISMFANAGISNGIALKTQNYLERTTVLFTTTRIEEGEAIDGTRNYEQSLLVGLGLNWERFSLEGRYRRGNGMSITAGISSVTNTFGVLGGFRF